jgi:hypothetical protein
MRIINDNGREVILLKAYNEVGKVNSKVDKFNETLGDLLKSFKGKVKTFVPVLGNNVMVTSIKRGETKTRSLNADTLFQFQKFSGFKNTNFKVDES